ncbi:MAG: GAF domain-containing protein [Rubrivivax sp.]
MSAVDPGDPSVPLKSVRRMLEGLMPPSMTTVTPDGMPHVNHVSHAEYVDEHHVALTWQFQNASRANILATRRACLSFDDPTSGTGFVMQLEYLRTETGGPLFERLRAKLAGIASHSGMEGVFHLRGADVYRVLELRRVPGRLDMPSLAPRCDVAAGARRVSEALAHCDEAAAMLDTLLSGLARELLIEHAMVWMLEADRPVLSLVASHGYAEHRIGSELQVGVGLVGTAVREGVPIRVGHMSLSMVYGRAARGVIDELGLAQAATAEIPLPGLPAPRSQLAVPLRARSRVVGALFAESQHDQFFSYDDEDALMLLAGQLGALLGGLRANEAPLRPIATTARPAAAPRAAVAASVRLRLHAKDNSVFADDEYVIRGVAGAILWKLAREHVQSGRVEFSNRELRAAADELRLPEVDDNLEVRLVLLQRRLAERGGPMQIEKTGRGRFRLVVGRRLELV